MPRPTRTPAPDTESRPQAVIASAARITTKKTRANPQGSATAWQDEVWSMLDEVGELEFYRDWVSNAFSRVTLHIERRNPDGTTERVTDPDNLSVRALAALFDGEAGQSEMLSTAGSHLALPGESWLLGLVDLPPVPDAPDRWRMLSRDEIKQQSGTFIVERGDGVEERYDDGSRPDKPAQALVIRVWRPHPRKWVHATSSCRSALPILRIIVALSRYIASTLDSRLAGAGLLAIPSEATFTTPTPSTGTADAVDVGAQGLAAELMFAMAQSLADPASPAARVPLILQAPGSVLEHIKHITFDTPLAEQITTLTDKMLARLAAALDVPAEVLQGLADVNHWTGYLLDENSIKLHVEPGVGVLVHAINTQYLWPIAQGDAPVFDPALRNEYVVADFSNLRQRPNRTAEAEALHGDLLITDAARLRESGFDDTDKLVPGSEEWVRRMRLRVASSTDPTLAAAALELLGVGLPPAADLGADATGAPVVPAGPATPALPAPAPVAAPGGGEPDPSAAAALTASATILDRIRFSAVLASADLAVQRGIERGWARAKGGSRRRAVAAAKLDDALTGVWDHLPATAQMLSLDADAFTSVCDAYTRGVLATGASHDLQVLRRLLHEKVLTDPDAGA